MRTDAERLQRLLRQEASLRDVIEAIGSGLDLRSLLSRIAEIACRLLEADNGAIGLVDEGARVVRMAATWRMPEDEIGSEVRCGQGLSGQVMETGRPVIYNRYGDVSDPTRSDFSDHAVIGVPIFWRDRLIGTFGLGSPPPRTFGHEDATILSRFAEHAAIAIENARLLDRVQSSLDEVQMLYETTARLGLAAHPDEIVAAYLDQVASTGKYACTVTEYVYDAADQRVGVLIKGRWSRGGGAEVGNIRVPYSRDALDPILDSGETVMIGNVETDPRVSAELLYMQRRDGHPGLALIPLIAGAKRIGLVVLTSPIPLEWDPAELRPYQATAGYLAIALQQRREQLELQEAERQVAVLEDRQNLAHELHDSVTQVLTSINFIAQATPAALAKDREEGLARLNQLAELSRRALAEMRSLLLELSPRGSRQTEPMAVALPLPKAIEGHLESIRSTSPPLSFCAETYAPQPPPVEHALLRITQEAVTNAIKHAQAAEIAIRLECDESTVRLTIRDDGVGLAQAREGSAGRGTGLGLSGIRRRVYDLGGAVRIHGNSGKGTVVSVSVPRSARE